MCGIAGFLCRPGGTVEPVRLKRAADLMADRGPDDIGFLGWWPENGGRTHLSRNAEEMRGAQAALVHRRLSILDLTTSAWQPMSSADGCRHLVFNGEIYNYRELREELEEEGVSFRSTGDTEVLLEAIGAWSFSSLSRFVGMFALALMNTSHHKLTLARDFFGIKPLFYSQTDSGFAFASSLKAILALLPHAPTANRQQTFEYLRFGLTDHSGQTLVDGVHHLPAGNTLEIDIDSGRSLSPKPFWLLTPGKATDISFAEATRHLRELFLDNVRLHMRSDVPVGAALSGGVDSSSIVMAMQEVTGHRLDLHTVSYHADDPKVSESRWIEIVNQASGSSPHRVEIHATDLIEDLDPLISAQEEPFGSTSIYAQFRVYRAASQAGLKVMLNGQGADEMLGGYHFFLASRVASLIRRGRWGRAISFARAAAQLPGFNLRTLIFVLGSQATPPGLETFVRRLAGKPYSPSWLRSEWFSDCAVDQSPLPKIGGRNIFSGVLIDALSRTSLPMILRYEDRNSMAFSIESRVPFLTAEIAEFLCVLPEEYIIDREGRTKAVFREAMRGLVPDEVLDRKDKIGFLTPELSWMRDVREWVESIILGETAHSLPVFNSDAIQEEWEGVLSNRRPFDWRVWRWINYIRWVELFSISF